MLFRRMLSVHLRSSYKRVGPLLQSGRGWQNAPSAHRSRPQWDTAHRWSFAPPCWADVAVLAVLKLVERSWWC